MAELRKKITELNTASTPLEGDELVPIVQDGVNTKTTVSSVLEPFYDFKNWDNTKTYGLNEPVFFQGSPYKSLIASNTNNQPDTSPTFWVLTGGGANSSTAGYSSPVSFDSGTDDALLYKDAAQATPVDGTGGTALYVSKSLDASTPLIGKGSLVLSKSANNAQGEGASIDFTIDRGQVTQTAQVSFCYETSTGYVDNDIGVYVYDKTNNVLMYPSIVNLPSTYGKPSNHLITFIPSTSNSYRLIFHVQSVSTAAYTVKVDNVQVGNKSVAIGAAIGNWVSYTPVISGLTLTTGGSTSFMWKRDGSDMLIRGHIVLGSAFTIGGALKISIPSGYSILLDIHPYQRLGNWAGWDASSGVNLPQYAVNTTDHPTNLSLGNLSSNTPITWATNDEITIFDVRVPISQWTSNVNLTSDFTEYASNSNTADADEASYVPANNVIGTGGSLIPALAIGLGMYNRYVRFQKPIQSTDLLIVEVDQGNGMWVSVLDRLGPWVNQGGYNTGIALTPQSDKYLVKVSFGRNGYAPSAGTYASAGTASWSVINTWKWRVRKISNGNMAEIPPVVRAEYGVLANTVQIGTSGTIINFHNRIEDTHNCVTTGASWKFTAPIDGVYSILGYCEAPPATTNFGTSLYECYFPLHKNGSQYCHIGGKFNYTGAMVVGTYGAGGSFGTTIRLKAGDYIHVTFNHTAGLFASAAYIAYNSRITITRIGN